MNKPSTFPGKVGLQQRVLPSYRVPFFDELAGRCKNGFSLFSGDPRPGEAILSGAELSIGVHQQANNHHWMSGAGYVCCQTGLLSWLDEWNPDILILEANPRYISNRAALRWMHTRNRPVIGWALGAPPIEGLLSVPRNLLRRTYLQRFNALITYSSVGAAEYCALGIPESRVFTAFNAVAPAPEPTEKRELRDSSPVRVLFVGRLQERKRIDLLLRACAAQKKQLEVTIVGDGPARTDLETLARQVLPAVRFTGAKEGEELRRIFKEADIFILPGTGGLAIQEAMSHALPVIAAEGDGTQRDLVLPENGWLVPPGDLEALTQTLTKALADPARLRRMGMYSHHLVSTRFNISRMADTFIEVMTMLVGERS